MRDLQDICIKGVTVTDIFEFINSRDVKEHLKKLDYRFGIPEAAWLIYRCRRADIKTKQKAWLELIDSTPDCAVNNRFALSPADGLHANIKQYIELQNRLIDLFFSANGCFYQFEIIYENGLIEETCTPVFDSAVFAKPDFTENSSRDEKIVAVKCRKKKAGMTFGIQSAVFDKNCRLTDISAPCALFGSGAENRANSFYYGFFEDFCFDFPSPFKKGDILHAPDTVGYCSGPFVFAGEPPAALKSFILKNGDSSDMHISGYFSDENGKIFKEEYFDVTDCEFYRKELSGSSAILKPLSAFLKGDIDPALFANACRSISLSFAAEKFIPHTYRSETLALAGFEIHE